MGTTFVYRLAPRSAFHFGQRGVGVEGTLVYCPADTLFSALCLTLSEWQRGGEAALADWLAPFLSSGQAGPPLRLSSAFPYAGGVLFFPKPLLPARLSIGVQEDRAKTLKKIAFVSERILRSWLLHESLDAELDDACLVQGGKVWVSREELAELEPYRSGLPASIRLWSTDPQPRVTVDRLTSRSAVYQAGAVRFAPGAGLFALVEFPGGADPVELQRLTTLFRVLGHGGLGGERSSGYGQFEIEEPAPFRSLGSGAGPWFLTLAPYHPTQAEVQAGVLGEGASYTVETRRGWVGAPGSLGLRRRSVRLLAEGSVLRGCPEALSYGDLVDVTPLDDDSNERSAHKVWRYGIAFPAPVVREEGD